MDRRQFLQAGTFLTVSSVTLGLSACAGNLAASSCRFDEGVASGDPRPDSIVLWTRVAGAGGEVAVTLELADNPGFSPLLHSVSLSARAEWDYTVRHKVTALAAGKDYYYRFRVGSRNSITGRTRTAPAAASTPERLKFAFIACQDWSVNHWGALDELLQQDLDFIVHLGDYIYETVGAGFQSGQGETRHAALTLPDGSVRGDGARYATTLADYRQLYRSYRSDSRLQALHARFPVIAVWDDHEFSDDGWQDRQTYGSDDDAQPHTARRRAANQAWFEFMPADVSFDAANPSFQNIRLYRDFRFGTLASLVMTDQRLYRADHMVPEQATGSEIGSRYMVPANTLAMAEAQKAGAGGLDAVSVLGGTQRQWWQQRMLSAQQDGVRWKLWGNEVSLLRMGVDGTQAVAGMLLQDLLQQFPALTPLAAALAPALLADLAQAAAAQADPRLSPSSLYPQLRAQLVPAALDGNTFDAVLVPAFNDSLPPALFFTRFILNADQWDGYNAERKALMQYLQGNAIRDVVALTGDIHAFFAGAVAADFDAVTPQPVMVDLVTAGVSSNSLYSYFEQVVDHSPLFAKARALIYREQNGQRSNTFNDTLARFNPWLSYIDSDAQGYALVTLGAASLDCTFHKLKPLQNGVAPQPATAGTQRLRVNAGTAAVTLLP